MKLSFRSSFIPTAEDRQRHQAMLRCVQNWMSRTRATQQRLVQAIEEFWHRRGDAAYRCDHTLLSRILNPVSPYVPTARRAKAMKILQAAMIVCANNDDPNLIAPAIDEDNVWGSDEEQAFKVHRARLRQLREHSRGTLFQALHRMGEFVVAARQMDCEPDEGGESFRARACENTLMTLAAIIDPGASLRRVTERLVAQGVDPVTAQQIQQQQIVRIDRMLQSVDPATVNMQAYAGAALIFCGQAERGVQMLIRACEQSHDVGLRHDPHWQTLLELLDRLLAAGEANARRWSRRAAQVALGFVRERNKVAHLELFRQSWYAVNAPAVAAHWADVAPEIIESVSGQHKAAPTSIPAAKPRRKARRVNLPAWLIAMTLTLAPALAGGGDAVAIRGREADAPPPPPPPPTTTIVVTV